MKNLVSIRDYVRWAATQFSAAGLYYGHGTDNAMDEAVELVLASLHLDHDLPVAYFSCRLTDSEANVIQEWVHHRIQDRVPLPYLTGRAWFAGMPFRVTPAVLVPRSPLAELIERGFQPWLDGDSLGRVLDLCTGSGCIAAAVAAYLPQVEVDAVDLSPEALAVARENLVRHELEDRVQLYEGDLYQPLPQGIRYDLILSNPPYVSEAEYAGLPKEYRQEPKLGLTASEEGLAIVVRLLRQAPDFLEEEGILICEVGNSAEALQTRYPEVPFVWLDFERGGEGVFLLSAAELRAHEF